MSDKINEFVRSQSASHKNMGAILDMADYLCRRNPKVEPVNSVVSALANEGVLNAKLDEAVSKGDLKVAASALTILLMRNEGALGVPGGQSWKSFVEKTPDLIGRLNESLVKTNYAVLDRLAVRQRDKPEIAPLVEALTSLRLNNGISEKFTTERAITDLHNYSNCYYESDKRRFFANIVQAKDFKEALEKQGFSSLATEFLYKLLEMKDELLISAEDYILRRLSEYTEENWKEIIDKDQEPFGLMQKCASPLEFGVPLADALKYGIGVLFTTTDDKFISRWFALSYYISKDARAVLYKDVRDKICRGESATALLRIFLTGKKEFLELAAFDQKPDDASRHVILNVLGMPEGLSWINDNADLLHEWVKKSDQSTRSSVGQKLTAAMGVPVDDNDDRQRFIKMGEAIQKSWGLKIQITPPEAAEKEDNKQTK